MTKISRHTASAKGFSTIELLVALFVAAVFIGAFYQVFTVIDQNNTETRWRAAASDLAYNNMRLYPTVSAVVAAIEANSETFDCSGTTDGWTIIDEEDTEPVAGIPGPITQTVTVDTPYAPENCSVVKVESRVQYGTDSLDSSREVIHATFVTN